jgi:hypothetical protein
MTDAPRPTPGKRIARAMRDERLARALRDNLHRRKEQARAQQQIRAGEPVSSDQSPPPQGGKKPPA